MLGVFSPLWVPIVTAASLLFLPVGIGMFVKETMKARDLRKNYMKDKASFMQDWTDEIMTKVFTHESIKAFINSSYLALFKISIIQLCEEYIPKQIAADKRQVNLIANDRRSSQEILKSFQPLQNGLRKMLAKLLLFKLEHMAKDVIDIAELKQTGQIGGGNFSNVYMATWKQDNTVSQVALKVLKTNLNGVEMYRQLEEVEHLR